MDGPPQQQHMPPGGPDVESPPPSSCEKCCARYCCTCKQCKECYLTNCCVELFVGGCQCIKTTASGLCNGCECCCCFPCRYAHIRCTAGSERQCFCFQYAPAPWRDVLGDHHCRDRCPAWLLGGCCGARWGLYKDHASNHQSFCGLCCFTCQITNECCFGDCAKKPEKQQSISSAGTCSPLTRCVEALCCTTQQCQDNCMIRCLARPFCFPCRCIKLHCCTEEPSHQTSYNIWGLSFTSKTPIKNECCDCCYSGCGNTSEYDYAKCCCLELRCSKTCCCGGCPNE